GVVDLSASGQDIGELIGAGKIGLLIQNNLEEAIEIRQPEVMVDFTHPEAVMGNIRKALNTRVNVVVGTTGITEDNLTEIKSLCEKNKTNAFIAPNFAIGAVLMMKLSEIAAKFLPEVEIIELHHKQKVDAPSGTALKTARGIMKITGNQTIPIHSVRLPGLVAHQEVIFGGTGQTLTIRHDSIDRTSFMPGVIMAIKNVGQRPGLTYGLEQLLGI
ncbi:MAG: 4-hydroxy-tetrahydrodipicolinate reductase, partial [Candidatus Subteraquimicrobiales bacterium]|nr:4-hydroxy-tetrahydrodipicolinate reductase [Candidatus Subteraquimicrobiales bacterium]